MNNVILIFIFFTVTVVSFSQLSLVSSVNPARIYLEWLDGDRDWWGHGPHVTGDIRIVVTEGKAQIIAFINLKLDEIGGDTKAEINETRLIYSAPAGKQIRSINFPSELSSHFDLKLAK